MPPVACSLGSPGAAHGPGGKIRAREIFWQQARDLRLKRMRDTLPYAVQKGSAEINSEDRLDRSKSKCAIQKRFLEERSTQSDSNHRHSCFRDHFEKTGLSWLQSLKIPSIMLSWSAIW